MCIGDMIFIFVAQCCDIMNSVNSRWSVADDMYIVSEVDLRRRCEESIRQADVYMYLCIITDREQGVRKFAQ